MKKRAIFIFLLGFLVSDYVVGQEKTKNSILVGINLSNCHPCHMPLLIFPGLSIEYERLLGNKFSVGVEIGTNFIFDSPFPYFGVRGRFYPRSGEFFTGLKLGLVKYPGFHFFPIISPEFGWKFDFEKNNNWFFMPSVAARFTIHNEVPIVEWTFISLGIKIGYRF